MPLNHHDSEQDPRVRATAAIWGISVGMLGVCIPLIVITSSGPVLPILVLVGASVSTSAIWLSSRQPRPERKRQLTQTVATLEERVKNLEAICSSAGWEIPPPTLPPTQQQVKRE